MKPEEVEDVYPLSPMQEGILFHSLYDREEEPYFRQWSGRLSGGLDVAGLLAAWHQVMDHHPVLRTAFVWQGLDKPLQVVCRAVRLPLVWQDWSQLAESDQRARLGDYLRRDRRRGFELSEAPLMRLALFDLGEGSWRMVWSFHHLLLDGWSLAIVLRQVMGAYLERQAGRSPSLPPAPPFRQYIAWLKGQELVAAESFWRQLLRGFERPTQLPIDRGSPLDNVTVSRHSRQRLISAATSDALTALCRSQRLTLNALFQGLWSLLLARYSGERSVVFGATVSGRPPELAQVESMVGLFINTLPVRSEVHAGDRLLPWLRDLQTVQARARQFSFAPLASIQRWAEVPAGQALFSTLLVFENYRLEEAAGPRAGSAQVTLEDTAFADGSSYPLSLILRPDAPISLRVLYSRERFEATAIDRLLGHLIALAEGALRAPASRLGELDLLSPAERQQLCREWSDTRVAYGEAGEGATLHGLIGRLAERDPEAVAVVCGDEALSYRQLIAGARGLAGRLVALGARPDGLVGIAAERSLELMVGLLAILEAGAAYVPIDPSYPAERLAFMLADSEVPLLLTLEAHRQSLPEPWRTGPGTLVLDREELLRHGAACGPCTGRGGGGDRLAYMIYTSGSTGRPKGAMNSHRAILNRLLWMQAEYRLGPGDRVLQKTPVSFDVSVWELFWPLMTGATLVLAEPGRHGDGSYLAAEIARRRITTLHFVPPMLRVFLAEPDLSGCDSVRRVMASGEALPGELAQRCYARLPQGARLHNLYGPTEAAVDVTYWACPPSAEVLPVPIGRPIANTAIHVLDERFAPTPIGVPGEVAIGGVNLARGYWRRPGLSAEKFVPDPVGEVEGERLYRTGDLARRWAGGEVEYLGRIDFQVKIRGFRIELGEIEAALLGCAGVLAAAVVVRPGPSGDGQLVAYFVTEAGSKVSPAELRRALGSRLPEHMVPAFWLHLDALPLTPSGKLDRKALPAPGGALAEAGLADPPEGPLEELVAGVWCEVLGLSRVGRGASFFELGGHSLLATRVVARLRETLGLEVPLRELFEHPRLVELAAALEERLRGAEGRARPALEARSRAEAPGGGAERLPLSWAQERLWFLEQWEPGGSVYNVPLALRLSGELSVPALAASLGVVEARHESLRTRFAGSGESAWQEVAAPRRPWPLPVVDVSGLATPVAEGEARRLMQQDMERGFDLARGPLWRGLLVRLGEAEHGLLLLLHHIASDGWSLGVLTRELVALYQAGGEEAAAGLPELPVQYGDYALWQRSWLSGELLAAELAWWRERLSGWGGLLELPWDRPRPAQRSSAGSALGFAVPAAVVGQLRAWGRRHGATLFMTSLGALQALLARLAGTERLVVGTPVAGRTERSTEELIGFFVNTLVVRGDLAGSPTGAELWGRVREELLAAWSHQEVPFEKLVAELEPERSPSFTPVFQVMFALQNAPRQRGGVAGLALSSWEWQRWSAKFDLTWSAVEEEGGGVRVAVEWSTALFDRTTIERWGRSYGTLLAAMAAAPERPVAALPWLSAAERWQLLGEWNDSAAAFPREATISSLFAEQVALRGEALALAWDDEQWSYGALEVWSAALARRLQARGAGLETPTVVALERSPEMVVAFLAILRLGSFYVPIDPSYPVFRQRLIVEEMGAALVVAGPEQGARLMEDPAAALAVPAWPGWTGPVAPARGPQPSSLAYVIFTSGSTGRPKGVAVPHRAVLRLVRGADYVNLQPGCRVAQASNSAFDAATFELWGALLNGGVLIGVERETALSLERFGALLVARRVDHLFVTTALFNQLAREVPASLASLSTLLFGGEAVDPRPVRGLLGQGGPQNLLHVYGPTENTTFSSWEPVRQLAASAWTVPIGGPISSTRLWVVSSSGEAVGAGVPGELWLGGEGLARGYWARPALTAERFVPLPFGEGSGERAYRTGDRVRWLAGGTVEFLGRFDHQVKLRGFRIELGEIEAVLLGTGWVRECVVLVRQGPDGNKQLVGWVVWEGERRPWSRLRERLGERLPEHMVPARWVELASLPLTPNGKVDRKALPEPGGVIDEEGDEEEGAAPEGWVEELVAGVWCEVLDLARVGRGASFFELGGHSLLATRVVARLRETLGLEVPLRELFEQPRLAELAAALEERLRGAGGWGRPALERRERGDEPERLPLSWAQERLWFLEQWEPGGSVYNVPLALRLSGGLSVPVLAASLGVVEERHESLRTRFAGSGESAWQEVVAARWPWPLPVVDVSGLAAPVAEGEARRLMQQDMERGFDLARGPLWRGLLVRLGETEHGLLLLLHHIASDGWSLGVLTRELVALYQAGGDAAAAGLAPLPVQYGDYALWQRSWLSGELLAAELAWWRQRLADWGGLLELPWDRPRPAQRSSAGSAVSFGVPAAVVGQLRAWGRRQGATLFMMLLGALQALLARLSGSEKLVVGTPVAGRTERVTEELIGFFVNTLVVRGDLAGSPTGSELWGRVREELLAAWSHQEVPFEKLVAELEPERSPSFTPLFQVMFVLQNAPRQRRGVADLALSSWEWRRWSAKFDLTWSALEEAGGGVRVAVEYATALFDRTTVERWGRSWATLLTAMAETPERPLAALPWLSAAERWQLLGEWNDSAVAFPREATIPALFAEQVALRPEAVALAGGEEQWSYAALAARSWALAGQLRAAGEVLERPVALFAERSVEVVVSLLAILEAGGFYLPLDPAYPEERLRLLLADAEPEILIVQGAEPAGRLGFKGRLVEVNGALGGAPPGRGAIDAGQLAYLVYTSGSTGRPKGVAVPHRAVVRLVRGGRFARLDAETRMLQMAPLAFDASTLELWGSLLNGGRLVIAPAGNLSLRQIGATLEEQAVTTAWLTAGLFHQLVEEELPALGGLRELLAGGDVLSVPHVRRVRAAHPRLRLTNGYGPTENTTFTACFDVGSGAWAASSVPIGGPISSTRLWVVSASGEAVGVGVPGELWTSGEGLARGYWARPALTAERFVPLPFGEGSGERAYRTGDRVRWLAGGTVEFLGRFDHQVKLRGFRIELGEIEAVLLGTGWVRECVVLVREGSGGDKQLVGWVVWEGQRRPFSQLREWLGERLPEHMVPARWIELGSLPLTPNGKVDRKALPEPGGGLGEEAGEEQGAAPEGWVEELVAGVWCEVLDLARVGRGASFFELGGHSLLATRVVARLRETLGLEVPLRELFERPTLVALAAGLEERLREAGGWHRPALAARPGVEAGVRRSGEADQLPLSWAQERLWFLEQWEPGGSVYNVPLALRLTGDLSVAALLASLGAVEERHQSLRTRFAGGGESAWQEVVAARRPWPLPVVDVSGLPARSAEGEARRLMQQDMERGFDLARGPLWRGLLVRLGAAEHGLLLVVHHIASDGWSLGVLTRELVALYQAGGDAAAAGLAPLPVQYGDYALWQRSWLSGELLASELAWWRQRLAGWGGLLELPWDRPRPAVRSSAGSALSFAVPAAVVGTLRGWGRRQGATLFMMLLGALQALLARLAGTERLVVGTPVAGRTERSTEDLIGFFVNTLVVRGDLAGSPTVAELWGRVREELLAAWSHQEVPFEKLVAELEPERSPSFTPLFQVSFVLQNAPRQGRGVAGLALSSWEWRRWSAKFDLTWAAVEEEGGGVRVAVEYATALFDRTTVERWGRSWATLLAAMADGPERPLAALPWLSAAERWQLLGEWNDSATASPSSPTVLDLFDHTLERCPERLALLEGEEHWSFSGLVRRSDGIAAWLQRSGAGPEAIVALLLPRSIDNVVATLGVARAGLAYLPVDPAYPDERVEYMVRDSGAWAILTSAELAPRAAGCGALCLAVDRLDAAGASPAPGRSWSVSPEHLAYVIYTSGSTGRPKGVEIQHGGLMNLVSWYQRVYAIAPEDRATLVAGPAFDASVFELWPCLLAGASLAIPAAEELTSARGLHRWLAERAVSVCFLPTPLAMSVLEEPPPALSRLRILMTAGDRLTRVGDAPPPFELYNLYGPTENTVAATSGRVAGACFAGRLPDLGRPIANVWTLVLDRGLEPVAAGVPGELWLGGRSLARGYRRRPGLTADRFRPDPFGATPGDRLYRTGDLVRWLASGVLDFLGRADAQVKIRGFRIELGEIEAVLRRCPLVVDCALDLRLGPPGDQRLVAYVVPSDAGSWSPPSLREHLARELPEYMVPGEWVQLSELPLTPNGKVDRRRLPAPAWGATGDERALSAPRDRFEIELTQLWQELFGREPIALEDDFFALGGHSLLALRLRSRIEKHFGQTLPVAALFEAPTIEQLARWLRREGQPARGRSLLVTFRSEGEALPLFLVHGAGGGVVDFASLAHALGGKQPVYGLQAPGIDGEPLAAPTIQQLAELHLGALRAVQPAGPYRLAGWSMGGLVALEIARLLCRQGEPIAQLCLLDSAPGPVLARAPRHRDDDLRDFARHLGITVGANTQELFGAALESGDLGVLLELAHRHRLLPPDVGLTDLERRLEVYRGNVEAALAYRAEPYPEPVLLVLAGEGAIARNGWLAAWEPSLPRAEVRIVAGDHFGMLQEPGVTELATLLRGVEKS